jgi:hypothetical protein
MAHGQHWQKLQEERVSSKPFLSHLLESTLADLDGDDRIPANILL